MTKTEENPISVRPRVCLLTHFLLHVALMQQTLQQMQTAAACHSDPRQCSYQQLRLFVWRKKSQSLCQHWSWFTWTLAQKILISSCPVLFNLDINLCLSSFDKVNSAVIVVKGNLFLGEKNLMHFDGILKNKQKSQIELLSELTRLKF